MGERIKRITRRMKRLFTKEVAADPPKLSASQVIRPELDIPSHGKRAPRSTTRRMVLKETQHGILTICVLRNGTTHVCFNAAPPTVSVRDPVTKRLSRKELMNGMRKTRGFYDKSGVLFDETGTNW